MLNCVPQERIATVNFVATFAQVEDSTTWYNWLSQGPIYIHFTSLVELLKDEPTINEHKGPHFIEDYDE